MMIFEPNKFYKHTTGYIIHTLDFADTVIYGRTLLAEDTSGSIISAGTSDNSYSVNYIEVTKDDFMNALPN